MKRLAIISALSTVLAAPLAAGAELMQATLTGYEEVPALSTPAGGQFRAMITNSDRFIDYELTYSGLTGTVTQAHIHFGQHSVGGGVMIWLCDTTTNPAPTDRTPACPQQGTVTGTVDMADVVGPAGQGLAAGDLEAAIAAIRAGIAYVNVHSSRFGPGEIRGQIRASIRP